MYLSFLSLHSLVRWFVLVSLLFSIYRAYRGWFANRVFIKFDDLTMIWTTRIAQIQLVVGICLYFSSPLVDYFLHNFKDAVRDNEIRFFGMEHGVMMFVAVVLITICSVQMKRKKTDRQKFRTMAIWLSIAFLIIIISIPFPFSSTASRPYFRLF